MFPAANCSIIWSKKVDFRLKKLNAFFAKSYPLSTSVTVTPSGMFDQAISTRILLIDALND